MFMYLADAFIQSDLQIKNKLYKKLTINYMVGTH